MKPVATVNNQSGVYQVVLSKEYMSNLDYYGKTLNLYAIDFKKYKLVPREGCWKMTKEIIDRLGKMETVGDLGTAIQDAIEASPEIEDL